MSEETVAMIISYTIRIVGAIVVLWIASKVARWAQKQVEKRLGKSERLDETLVKFGAKATRAAILVIVGIAVLGVVGIQTASFVAVLATAGLAIGLAFQGTLSNFSAGIMLLIFRPFKIGNVVLVAGETGKVAEIAMFTTIIDTPDNRRIIIPNSAIFGSKIENVTYHDTRRVDLAVGVDYSADIDATRAVLEGAAKGVEGCTEEKGFNVILANLNDSSVDWVVRLWCPTVDYFTVKERGTEAIKRALDKAQIGIPYPTMDLNVFKAAA